MTPDIETQIRSIADAAFDETAPVRPALRSTAGDVAGFGSRGRWMLVAAASVLVIALVGAVVGGASGAGAMLVFARRRVVVSPAPLFG